jgi:Na+/proline symporter
MRLGWIDWGVILGFIAYSLWIGLRYTKRASQSVEQYFLSGRTLGWWLAGTSMVATSFSADTPLVVTGWVRDGGVWKNWVWWCFAVGGVLHVFFFARWWRRGEVMTKAELVELRYGGAGARFLRGTLGAIHAFVTNTITLCWVLLASAKILDVLFDLPKGTALVAASLVTLFYTAASGFWGVVLTDQFQFVVAMLGMVVLGAASWNALDGVQGLAAAQASGAIGPDMLRFLPGAGPGGWLEVSFWTPALAAIVVYLGIAWWAHESVDGTATAVQRISAARDERQGMLAMLWFNVAHYALRPWGWIATALASLVLLPAIEVRASEAGTVRSVEERAIVIDGGAAGGVTHSLRPEGSAEDWKPVPVVKTAQRVEKGALLARTDSEAAYVTMMQRYLPVGVLGLMVASLLAAFMSTVTTHINLAASYFVNDVYRRFVRREAADRHYIGVARLASVAVLAISGTLAYFATSISELFLFFLAFLSGVGPVYVLRWLWWRVRASTEIAAMLASCTTASALTHWKHGWHLGPLSPGGELSSEGRLILTVCVSTACALLSMLLTRAPDPAELVPFCRRVRPLGAWGPVRALAGEPAPRGELGNALLGAAGALGAILAATLGLGFWILDRGRDAALSLLVTIAGTAVMLLAMRRLEPGERAPGAASEAGGAAAQPLRKA